MLEAIVISTVTVQVDEKKKKILCVLFVKIVLQLPEAVNMHNIFNIVASSH